ncbi:hypothetical protein F4810DRAFT_701453 [Camillea tinctor]|nr:hypothetical protein F4810DRAFT_701453 [Camillea tinctor]
MSEQLNPVIRKRRRPAKSCEPCRSRKVKCDRGLPCKSCKRARTSLHCSYKPGLRLSPTVSQQPTTSTQSDDHIENCKESSEGHELYGNTVPSVLQPPVDSPKEAHDHTDSQAELSRQTHWSEEASLRSKDHTTCRNYASGDIQDLEARISKIEKQLSTSTQQESTPDKTGLHIKLPHPHLRIEHEKTRLFGPSHWVHSLGQFQTVAKMQVKPYSIIDATQAEAAASLKEVIAARHLAKSRGAGRLQEPMPNLAETLPARSICDEAIDGYLRTFEPIFRILHVPSFRREYEEYWLYPEASKASFLMKLIMVLAIGAIFLPDKSTSDQIRGVSREWAYAVQWWLIGPTERDAMNLDGVQVFCLLLLARQATSLGGTSSIMTEALLKLCFTIGLHLDPKIFSSLSVFESEMRRRLWATSLELLTITSMNSSLPLSVNADDVDLPAPSDIADDDLADNEPTTSTTASPKQGTFNCSVQNLLLKSLPLRIRLIRQLNNAKREYSYEAVLASGRTLTSHCRSISAFFQPACRTSDFQRIFLDTYLRRIILFLHRPFAALARQSPQFQLARRICLESALASASHMDLGCPDAPLDDYARLCVRGSGLYKGALGQDVVSALALEVFARVEEEREYGAAPSPSREPLVRALQHLRAQWREIMRMGRPSLKQYLFLSVILRQIEAVEQGHNPKLLVYETFSRELRECAALLRESGVCEDRSGAADGWVDDASFYGTDPFGIFGFDLCSLDPTVTFDAPDWPEILNIGEPDTVR